MDCFSSQDIGVYIWLESNWETIFSLEIIPLLCGEATNGQGLESGFFLFYSGTLSCCNAICHLNISSHLFWLIWLLWKWFFNSLLMPVAGYWLCFLTGMLKEFPVEWYDILACALSNSRKCSSNCNLKKIIDYFFCSATWLMLLWCWHKTYRLVSFFRNKVACI